MPNSSNISLLFSVKLTFSLLAQFESIMKIVFFDIQRESVGINPYFNLYSFLVNKVYGIERRFNLFIYSGVVSKMNRRKI